MSLLHEHKKIERDLEDMRRMGICTRLPVFCCRNDPARKCELVDVEKLKCR